VTKEHVGGRRWRSVAGLAWLRGALEWCVVVSASAHGAEERSDEAAEADIER
jgi:hypothetical protein